MGETQLVQIGLALVTLATIGAVATRLGQSVIPAYIVSGILIGPYVPKEFLGVPLALVTEGAFISVVAELGIVFLLFFLGLEFHIETLINNWKRLTTIGGIDLVVNAAVGVAIAAAFGLDAVGIILVAGVVYISSSAIITKTLTDYGWVANPESEAIFGTLVIEDLVIAVYLAVVSAVVLGGGTLLQAATSILQAFAFLGVLAAVAWAGSSYLETVFGVPDDELFVLRVLGTTILVAAAALALGVSEAVAAFFVGMAFGQTDLEARVDSLLLPFRDVFAAFFFFSIGLTTNLLTIRDVLPFLAVAVVCTTVSKLLSGVASGRVYGLTDRRSLRVGLGLVARGEFSLVIATLAATSTTGQTKTVVPAFAIGYVLVMSLLGTLCIQYETRLARLVGSPRPGGPTAE
ncbi:cation:proton antiporter [Halarchaeum sp. P4]|uniref:cation:proton antiporter n=1 Tax=Halarchaeum sp. P4 TaxID=3421639 RepID=UPI003EBB93CC